MPSQLFWKAAAAGVCVLIATSAGFAQTATYQQSSTVSTSPATLVGTYRSNDFFPNPLVLNITGMDRDGNLSGSISGLRGVEVKGQVDWRFENWQRVFGKDSQATYKDGKVTIVFPNGATYTLQNRGNDLAGTFVANNERSAMSFLKSQGIAGR